MPTSSAANSVEKRRNFRLQSKVTSVEIHETSSSDKAFLKIEPALPCKEPRKLYKRSHSTLSLSNVTKEQEAKLYNDSIVLYAQTDGTVLVSRSPQEKENNSDRISLDRRGLTNVPIIKGEVRLRLLSMQHNLLCSLDGFKGQNFPFLVFLDIYDNQLDRISGIDTLENLRVLLIGKNRLKRIEGVSTLKKIEVLDLHGNQISHVGGLSYLTELKVLNLAGNQIRNIGMVDLSGLSNLLELNLRRNRLRKLLGFGETPNLAKLYISNNDLQSIEDISSLAKASNIKEICIDNNPLSLGGDCVSFLVSYLPQLVKLNQMQITDQVRKAAMAWRRNKENTNAAFLDLTSDVCLNVKREEVISNARTNWELLRAQTKCLTNANCVPQVKDLRPDADFILTSLNKTKLAPAGKLLPDKKLGLIRSSSQDTEVSQNTSSSNTSSNEYLRLPPILVPIIDRMALGGELIRKSSSLSSIDPNVDSCPSSLESGSEASSCQDSSSDEEGKCDSAEVKSAEVIKEGPQIVIEEADVNLDRKTPATDSSSNISGASTSILSNPSVSTSEKARLKPIRPKRSIKSAINSRNVNTKLRHRAVTAKVKKSYTPPPNKDREQGGDYLIEVSGQYLDIYGHGALRFIDKAWNVSKANDVTTVRFNYVNYNGISGVLNKLKQRFPNVENFVFKETNIYCLGQLNALAETQGLTSLFIDAEGNPIYTKQWRSYAIYRLSHWGLKIINNVEVTDEETKAANEEYESLSDLVLWSLPDILLQPLLVRLRINVNHNLTEQNAKRWLLSADPALRVVVSKEALQWKKGSPTQEDLAMRQKAKHHIMSLLKQTEIITQKLKLLDEQWPSILHEIVRNTLLDYTQLDVHVKGKMQELKK